MAAFNNIKNHSVIDSMKSESPESLLGLNESEQVEENEDQVVDNDIIRNLLCCIIIWTSGSFNYYLIAYQLKYIQGDLYINTIVSSTSEVCAFIFSGVLINKYGIKKTLIGSNLLAIVGMSALNLDLQSQILLPLCILGSKFGVACAFNVAFVSNQQLFPVSFVATSMGYCNIFSNVGTIFAPYVAELKPESISKHMFVTLCVFALLAGTNLK